VKSHSRATPPAAVHASITFLCVIPLNEYAPVEVHSSPLRTMKKLVELQLATKPRGSSISASSAPAYLTLSAQQSADRLLMGRAAYKARDPTSEPQTVRSTAPLTSSKTIVLVDVLVLASGESVNERVTRAVPVGTPALS